ncbi:DUF3775 domain-containing protein [Faunimonas sp. B44]|uniref:DUF3775 domain-containing protein n=1 Tax=Faunimonas sp. B44 TaxID=3461493 RepID=UPI0040449252
MLREMPAAADLAISPDKVCYIIARAREFDAKVEPVDTASASNPADDTNIDVLEDNADDPTLQELSGAIAGLNEDETVDLIAISWIGRGDFEADELEEARQLANERHRRNSARYLTGMPLLGDYLEEGLSALGFGCEDSEMAHL